MSNLQKYHVSKNLFNYVKEFDGTAVPYNDFFNYYLLRLSPNTQYTATTNCDSITVGNVHRTSFIICPDEVEFTTINGGIDMNSPRIITTMASGIIKVGLRTYDNAQTPLPIYSITDFASGDYWLMLNIGSIAMPYEPYSTDVWHDLAPQIRENGAFVDTTNNPEKYQNGSWS